MLLGAHREQLIGLVMLGLVTQRRCVGPGTEAKCYFAAIAATSE